MYVVTTEENGVFGSFWVEVFINKFVTSKRMKKKGKTIFEGCILVILVKRYNNGG